MNIYTVYFNNELKLVTTDEQEVVKSWLENNHYNNGKDRVEV